MPPAGITSTYVGPPASDAPPGTPAYAGQPEVIAVDFTFDHLHYLIQECPWMAERCIQSRDRRAVMLAAGLNANRFGLARPEFKDDVQIVLEGITNDINPFLFCTPRVRNIREVVVAAARQDGRALLGFVPEIYLADREVVSLAIKSVPDIWLLGLPRQCIDNPLDYAYYQDIFFEAADAEGCSRTSSSGLPTGPGASKACNCRQNQDNSRIISG